eukprot:1196239-Prorocentrum_minimum.AAC.4
MTLTAISNTSLKPPHTAATMRAAVIAALFAGVAMGSANAAYNVGDVLSAEDRATNFTACDGTTHTLGSFLDAGKTLVIDKSAYS